ncbi:MAG: hypothetical protein KDB03_02625 [Planctomycetales bacterium]|nr:hypothetical protein [Planctomycetales bacterium]
MPNLSLDWDPASEEIQMNVASTARLKSLAKHATQEFYHGGGYSAWQSYHRIDMNAFDVAFADVTYSNCCLDNSP